jgi:hypothetical protein
MLRTSLITSASLLLLLAACEPKGPPVADAGAPVAAGCDARAQRAWTPDPPQSFSTEAITFGPDCAKAVVTLVVRSADGQPILAWAARTQDIFGLYDAADATAMKSALADWMDQANSSLGTASELPAWTQGRNAPGPEGEEFPFHPESWLDQPAFEQIRKENAPLFAFAQGRESLAVYLLRDGQLEPIGLQQFPG